MEQLNMRRRPVRRVDISINMEATGANIRRLVKGSGYSVRDIMAITGISTEQAVYKWFRGESIPAIETMLILCDALGVTIKELLVVDGEFNFTGFNDPLRISARPLGSSCFPFFLFVKPDIKKTKLQIPPARIETQQRTDAFEDGKCAYG